MKKRRQYDPVKDVIGVADNAYGDGLVGLCYRYPKRDHGDSLAAFIVREIRSVCSGADYKEALTEAARAMERARDQLDDVTAALHGAAENILIHQKVAAWKAVWDALSDILEDTRPMIPKNLRKRADAAIDVMKREFPEEA